MKKIILKLTILLALIAPTIMPVSVFAACATEGNATNAKQQVEVGLGEAGGECSGTGVNDILGTVVTILSFVAGAVAVVMIIISGFKYITSGGDSNKVSSAKSTLIYAIVGLVVAALAQIIVHFVIHQATDVPCPTGQHRSADGTQCIKN